MSSLPELPQKELLLHDPFWIPEDPDEIPDAPRAVMAFELRKAGATYELIAEKLGYASPNSARNAILNRIQRYYKANEEEVSEIVGLELARLDQLQLICWQEAKDHNLSAVDRILKIMERRAKLLGLDQEPSQEASTVNQTAVFIGGSEQDYLESINQAQKMLAGKGVSDNGKSKGHHES